MTVGIHQYLNPLVDLDTGSQAPPSFDFDPALAVFTPNMEKRAGGVFNLSPFIQGDPNDVDGLIDDELSFSRGNLINGVFYENFDANQGSISFWFTPEYSYDDLSGSGNHFIFEFHGTSWLIYEYDEARFRFGIDGNSIYIPVNIVSGTRYHICLSWDSKNTLDGTNYARVSINDSHTFGATVQPDFSPASTIYVGGRTQFAASAMIEGLTVTRLPLFDGQYGVDLGKGDVINQIYNAGAGKDLTEIAGSWDIVFCLPTKPSPATIATGTGEAWSHPHSSALLGDTYCAGGNVFAAGERYLRFDGLTSSVDCGSDASLDNLPAGDFTVEAWVRAPAMSAQNDPGIVSKSNSWKLGRRFDDGTSFTFYVYGDDDTMGIRSGVDTLVPDTWHHVAATWESSTKTGAIYVDGIYSIAIINSNPASMSNLNDDSSNPLFIGRSPSSREWDGDIAWVRISDNIRYTSDFTPPAKDAPPATDANTVEQWNLNDGSGTTAVAEVSASNNGTITDGEWPAVWEVVGTTIKPTSLSFNGDTSVIDCGSDASLDNLAAGDFTVEAWTTFAGDTGDQYGGIVIKSTGRNDGGWSLVRRNQAYGFDWQVHGDTENMRVYDNGTVSPLNEWHHVAVTWDNSTKTGELFVDGVSRDTDTGAMSNLDDDSGLSLYIGRNGDSEWDGNHLGNIAWVRISNNIRYSGPFTPPSRTSPPTADGNTIEQWNLNEGSGTAAAAQVSSNNNGTITDGVWISSYDMASESPADRVYDGGYVFGASAIGDGIQQTIAGLSNGQSMIGRFVLHSSEDVDIVIYDETTAATIKTFTVPGGGTAKAPSIALFTWDGYYNGSSFTNYTSVTVKVLSTVAGQTIYLHQAEIHNNIIVNPSMDAGSGDPWIPDGWNNILLDAGDTEAESTIVHSGSSSVQFNSGATASEVIRQTPTFSVGDFVLYGAFLYGNGTVSPILTCSTGRASLQSKSSTDPSTQNTTAAWEHRLFVARMDSTDPRFILSGNDGASIYADDAYAILLDPVSMTVVPASLINSTERTGTRVDGRDTLIVDPIPVGKLAATSGKIRFSWTPRHDYENIRDFGMNYPYVCEAWYDANNRIYFYKNNTGHMRFNILVNGVEGGDNWAATGEMLSGVTYQVRIEYDDTDCKLYINDVLKATATPVGGINFGANIPNKFYGLNRQQGDRNIDATISVPS